MYDVNGRVDDVKAHMVGAAMRARISPHIDVTRCKRPDWVSTKVLRNGAP